MSEILIGPLLRYVSETEATVWVETDEACEVAVLGAASRPSASRATTTRWSGSRASSPASPTSTRCALDGERRWPRAARPAAERDPHARPGEPLDVCFGSCRVAVPHEQPYTEAKDEDETGYEVDALRVLAREMVRDDRDDWPDLLFLLGDQVYVDEGSPADARADPRPARHREPPGEEVTDFEEYTWLYHESWREPLIRWLFSIVSTSMLWDDHDMSDDWNISRSWVDEMRPQALVARAGDRRHRRYWIYQHLGNLSPRELDEDEIYAEVRGNQHATACCASGRGIDSTAAGTRWSFCRDLDGTRAVFVDSRAGRVLTRARGRWSTTRSGSGSSARRAATSTTC